MDELTERLEKLKEQVRGMMSPKRFDHTAAVSEMAGRMAALYCPEQTGVLQAAGLLHDITKEKSIEEQFDLCRQLGIPYRESDRLVPKTMHAKTAAGLIPVLFPEWNEPGIVQAVRWHTTGHAGMTIGERILYFADYIDETRKFEDCVTLRRLFWDPDPGSMDPGKRQAHLRDLMILSYDMTIRNLLDEHTPVSIDTIEARNALLLEAAGISEDHPNNGDE